MAIKQFFKNRSLKADDKRRTRAAELTLRESIYPLALVTVLFFLWGFSYGLLDTLNKHFQVTLNINQARSAGLQAAYFGCVLEFENCVRHESLISAARTRSPRSAMPPGSSATMATVQSSSGDCPCMRWEL